MTTKRFSEAMNYMDDNLISEAITYKRTKKTSSWLKWGALVACLCVVIVGVFTMLPYEDWWGHQADDPNWHLTHFQTTELSEIEALCGTDLLLDRISMSGEYHSEYILEISENGLFDNAADWSNLSVSISNGENINDQSSADYIYCFISFDGETDGIDTSLWESKSSMEMNGYAVSYNEKTTADYADEGITLGYEQNYHGYAVFDHAGYTYYLSTHSDNPEFFDETLKNKLIYGATHDPNADNSEHAITGSGKPLEPTE